jgi:hypothetical protein
MNPRALSPARAIVNGTLTVGTLDLLDAFGFFYLRSGATPVPILHSIASGVLGAAAARSGGMSSAALGFFLHFLIAFIIVSIYFVASRRIPILRRRPFLCGIGYGVIAYFVMTYLVVPMSNARSGGPFVLPVFINGILIHALAVGLPSALFAARVPSGETLARNLREEPP